MKTSMIAAADRIASLRKRCLERKRKADLDRTLIDAASFRASEGKPERIRVAQRTRDRLSHYRFSIDDLELLAGRPAQKQTAVDRHALDDAKAYLATLPFSSTHGQTGHCELDRSLIFKAGIDGAMERIRERQLAGSDAEKRETYETFLIALEGLSAFFRNAAAAAESAARTAVPERQQELAEMRRICAKLEHNPPETFHEALQCLALIDLAVTYADNAWLCSPGHLDRTLLPFYEADRASGLTRDTALLLLESFYLLINEVTPDGLAIAVMVGGRDENGRDLTNDLSHLCLEAIRRTKLVYPTVGVCWHDGTPADLTKLTIDLMADGYSTPAFFGDATIQKGLREYGVPPSESWNYVNSTCVEITPVGASNIWVASPYFPVCRYLLDTIDDAVAHGDPPATFDALVQRYEKRLAGAIAAGVKNESEARRQRAEHGGKPLQSVFTADCIERGLDIDRGSARYNWVECSFVGLANLADSLHVIRREVFEERRLDLAQLKTMLDANFTGHENERQRFLHAHAKYGHADAAVDGVLNRVVECLKRECRAQRLAFDGAPFIPGAFCWIMHEWLGRECGATPDGRLGGTPFADGCGPAQGRETRGPTAGILSTTSWAHHPLIGGAAYNMRFMKSLFASPSARERLRDLVLTFLQRGGFEVQVNAVDAEVLKKAQERPAEYADLVVRIGGYTDYFTRLSPQMQAEVMQRTEFDRV